MKSLDCLKRTERVMIDNMAPSKVSPIELFRTKIHSKISRNGKFAFVVGQLKCQNVTYNR